MVFLKRELGYLIYLILILVVKIIGEIISDGLSSDDFIYIISYSFLFFAIINFVISSTEFIVSLFRNKDPKFWVHFDLGSSIIVLIVLLIAEVLIYSFIPRIDTSAIRLLIIISLVGEISRIYYNHRILKD